MSSSKNKSQPWWVDANNDANYEHGNNDVNDDDNNRRRHHNNNINNNRRGSSSSSDRYLKQQQQQESRTVATTSTSTTRPTSSSTRAFSTNRAFSSSPSSAIDNSNKRLPEEKRERISSSSRPSSSSTYRPSSSSSGGRKKASSSSRGEKEQITSSGKNSNDAITIAANASTKRSTPTPLPPKRTEPKSSSSIKWTCDACTYLNVRDCPRSSSLSSTGRSRHDNDTTKFPTLMCEMCCTPYIPLPSTIGTTTTTTTSREQEEEEQQDPFDIERNHKITKETRQSSGGTATTARSSSISSWSPWNTTTTTDTTNNNDNDNGDTSQSTNSSAGNNTIQHYSMRELIKTLNCVDGNNANNSDVTLPPALEQRVKDFKFAQQKRREKHGDETPWGIYGLYAHLSDIRADLEWAEDAAWRRQRQKPYLSWRDFDKSRCEGGGGSGSGSGGGLLGFLSISNRPIFTYGVMILCTIMMFVTFGVNGWKFEPLTINPLIGPSSETLIQCGARDTALIVNEGQWFRLFTPMILHAGLIHYFVNMLALFFIGGAVEKAHGIASTAVLFIIPAVGGNILSAICLPGFISVGASGGIFGLIGGCMADICLNWNLLFLKTTMTDDNTRSRALCVLLWLAMDILINTILGFTPFVDNFTHLGGFIYGFCIGFASIERLASGFFGIRSSGDSKCSRFGSMVLRYFGLILSIIAIMVTTVILVQSDGVTTPCPGCRYISCVPFPPNADEKWWYCDDCDIVTANLFQTDSGLYEQVNINCPNGDVEEIAVIEEGIYDLDILRRKLPSYCRSNCDEVFASY